MTDQIAFGSGYTSRIAALRTAVHNLLDELAASHADNVRVDLISFNTSATSLGIFDLKDLTELDAALNTIDHLSAGGNTNYEAALQAALNWVHSTGSDAPLTGANVVNQPSLSPMVTELLVVRAKYQPGGLQCARWTQQHGYCPVPGNL
jgi:hypothetical protein